MNLEEARSLIQSTFDRMDGLYGKPIFDEWVVISLSVKEGRILHYHGSRKEDFQKNFNQDIKFLISELRGVNHHLGDFEFTRHGSGTHFDAYMVVGDELFLICNHTSFSMEEITRDTKWLGAQVPFIEMTDKFRHNPLLSKH